MSELDSKSDDSKDNSTSPVLTCQLKDNHKPAKCTNHLRTEDKSLIDNKGLNINTDMAKIDSVINNETS